MLVLDSQLRLMTENLTDEGRGKYLIQVHMPRPSLSACHGDAR